HRGGRRAVTGDVRRLGRHLAHHLRAHVLVRVVELDLLGHAHAVLRDGGRAPLLVEHDVAAARSERHLHGLGEDLPALHELGAGLLAEQQHLGSHWASEWESGGSARGAAARVHLLLVLVLSTPRTSSSRRITYSVPSIFTSVPLYLPTRMRSPFFTSTATRLPSSVRRPGPTATTSPSCGFSLAVSGMMMPPRTAPCLSVRAAAS